MLVEPGNKNDEQVAVLHADASGGYIVENQHEKKIMRHIRVNKKDQGQQAKNNWTNGERQNDLSMKLQPSASSNPCVAPEYLVSCEIQSRLGSVLVQKSGRVDDDMRMTSRRRCLRSQDN